MARRAVQTQELRGAEESLATSLLPAPEAVRRERETPTARRGRGRPRKASGSPETSTGLFNQFPPFAALFVPPRDLRPGEQSLHVPELDDLKNLKVVRGRDILAGLNPLLSRTDLERALERPTEIMEELEEAFMVAARAVWQKAGCSVEQLSTAPPQLRNVRLINSEGQVVFESFSHLLTVCATIGDFYKAEEVKIEKRFNTRGYLAPGYSWAPTNFLFDIPTAAEDRIEAEKFTGRFEKGTFPNAVRAYVNLPTLDEVNRLDDLDPLGALAALTDACMNTCGSVDQQSIKFIQSKTFSDTQGRFFCTGSELITRAGCSPDELLAAPPAPTHSRESFPAIRGFQKPRRLPAAGESPVHLRSLEEFSDSSGLRAPFTTAEEFLKGSMRKNAQTMHIAYKLLADTRLKHLHTAVREAFAAVECTEADLHTQPRQLRNVVFTDSAGKVVCANFGHLISLYLDARRFYFENLKQCSVLRQLTVSLDDFATVSPGKVVEELYRTVNKQPEGVDGIRKQHRARNTPSASLPPCDYVISSTPEESFPPHRGLELLREACLQRCGEISLAAIRDIAPLTFAVGPTKVVTGDQLIDLSGISRALADPRAASRDTLDGITATIPEGTRESDSTTSASHRCRAREQIRRTLYRTLFENLDVSVRDVFFASCILQGDQPSKKGYRSFSHLVERSIAEPGTLPGEAARTRAAPSALSLFAEVIEAHSVDRIDISAVAKEHFATLLYQLSYRLYEGSYDRMLADLRDLSTDSVPATTPGRALAHDILEEVVPLLLKRLESFNSVVVPAGLPFVPFDFQRQAGASALALDKLMIFFWPGAGKTQTAITLAETFMSYGECTGVFWGTTAGARPDTANRLRRLVPAERTVLELIRTLVDRPLDAFIEALDSCDYLVASYHTTRSLLTRRPAHFEALQRWIRRGVKILDEAHKLDNPNSKSCLTLRSLPSVRTAVFTGTPVQHRKERLATHLHLTLPERFPDPDTLIEQFAKDPSYSRALLHQYGSLLGITDIAKVFTPFHTESAEEQLASGIPRIPKLHIQRHSYPVSYEHALAYVNLATNFDSWADQTGWRKGSLVQLSALRKLISNPSAVGCEPPYALLAAVKEKAIPHLCRGEKVLVLGQFLPILKFLASDPEFQSYGAGLITGGVPAEERETLFQRLEDDPSFGILFGQITAAGSSYNARSVAHLILLPEPAQLTSEIIQGIGRVRRLLTKGDERFARQRVTVTFLEPELPEEVFAALDNPRQAEIVRRGTVYRAALSRDLERLDSYTTFMASPGAGRLVKGTEETSLREIVDKLAQDREKLIKERHEFALLRQQHLEKYFFRYRAPSKTNWREQQVDKYIDCHFAHLGPAPDEIVVACLGGPEILEVPLYLSRGVARRNILVFEASADPLVQSFARQRCQKEGVRFFDSKIQRVLPYDPIALHIASIDTDGNMTPDLASLFPRLHLANKALVLLNRLCAREHDDAKELLEAAGGQRETLDRELVLIAGAERGGFMTFGSMPEAVRFSMRLSELTHRAALRFARTFGGGSQEWLQRLETAARPWGRVRDLTQFTYQTPGGSTFLSTFAAVEKPSAGTLSKTALQLGETLREIALRNVEGPIGVTFEGRQVSIPAL